MCSVPRCVLVDIRLNTHQVDCVYVVYPGVCWARAAVQVDINQVDRPRVCVVESAFGFQPFESTSLSSRWFHISTLQHPFSKAAGFFFPNIYFSKMFSSTCCACLSYAMEPRMIPSGRLVIEPKPSKTGRRNLFGKGGAG